SPGRLAVAIDQLCAHIVQLRLGLHSGHTLVHPQPLVLFLYIVGRNSNVETEIELNFRDLNARLALHFADSAFQHLGVKFESHRFDVAALLAAEQIPRASWFEVKGSDLEAGAKV